MEVSSALRDFYHNGEINTIKGNTNWMKAREMECSSEVWKSDEKLNLLLCSGGSDPAELDNALELMGLSSNAVLRSISRLIPEAYEKIQF